MLLLVFAFPIFFAVKKGIEKDLARVLNILIGLCLVSATFYFGFRGWVGTDTPAYIKAYDKAYNFTYLEYLEEMKGDFFFYSTAYVLQKIAGIWLFFTLISLSFLFGYYSFVREIKDRYASFVMFGVLGFFFVMSLNSNVIRSAFAFSFFFMFMKMRERKSFWSWVFLALGILSHISTLLAFGGYFLVKKIKNVHFLICLWIIAVVLSIMGIGLKNLPVLSEYITFMERLEYYTAIEDGTEIYRTGFRIDFTFFNFMPIVLGYIAYFRREKPFYYPLYLFLSIVFIFAYDIPFSDRIGVFSWLFIPLIIYDFSDMPLFKRYNVNFKIYYLLIVLFTLISMKLIL